MELTRITPLSKEASQKVPIERDDLVRLYYEDHLSYSQIGAIYGCHAQTICNRMKEFGLQGRSYSDSLKGRQIPWASRIGRALLGRKHPGVGGRKIGSVPWNRGLSKVANPDLVRNGVPGDRHWAWKGGISPINKRLRQSSAYLTWRRTVFVRDHWTCQRCGDHSSKGHPVILNAHHKNPFSTHPDLRYDTDNGITLCSSCHRIAHSKGE